MTANSLIIYSDGGARGNPGPAASAFIVIKNGKLFYKKSSYLGRATNNFAEYSGVVMALDWLREKYSGGTNEHVTIVLDSELVTKQLSGKYRVKSNRLKPLILKIRKLEKQIDKKIVYKSVTRDKNKLADYLVNKALDEKSLDFTSSKKRTPAVK